MGDLPPDAALRIARWIWPTAEWQLLCGKAHSDTHRVGLDLWSWNGVHFAEGVLIKRGLAKAYGGALVAELTGQAQLDSFSGFEEIALVATAPLDARVRALLVVVEEQERKP